MTRRCARGIKMLLEVYDGKTGLQYWGKTMEDQVSCKCSLKSSVDNTDIPTPGEPNVDIFAVLLFGRVRLALFFKLSCDAWQMWQRAPISTTPEILITWVNHTVNLCG